MVEVLTFSEIIVSILLIFLVLIQNKNSNLNLTSMSGWMWTITKRWPEKIMFNTTIVLWTLFILNSLFLVLLDK